MSEFWCLAGLDALARILLETASNQARELGRQVAPHVGDGAGVSRRIAEAAPGAKSTGNRAHHTVSSVCLPGGASLAAS